MNIKVSFDYDETLDHKTVQRYAKELVDKGIEIWIVTSIYDDEHYAKEHYTSLETAMKVNNEIFEVAKEIGIPEERIHFTNM